jgi:ammonium transporter, Amt family
MLVSTILVLLMIVPGLALFYGGLVRTKNMLSVLTQTLIITCIVMVVWALWGYSEAFTDGGGLNAYVGGFSKAFLKGVDTATTVETFSRGVVIPEIVFVAFQMTFAAITTALVIGGFAERMKFSAVLWFSVAWLLLVYLPICHWVWGGGWLAKLGALDFAGGTVVHVNAAAAALVVALALKPRKDYARRAILPHNVPFSLLGAGLLWFGWFGFNGGSALAANGIAALAFVNTMLAPIATLVVWTMLDLGRTGRATAVGAATSIVVGLVAVTPAAGFVSPMSALLLGAVAAVPSYFALLWRARTRVDDSLDVVAAHGVGGTVGALATGVLAQKSWNGVADGLLFGNPRQLVIQAVGVLGTIAFSAAATFVIIKLLTLFGTVRASVRDEGLGLDVTQHGEEAYSRGEGAILVLPYAAHGPAHGLPVAAATLVETGAGSP